MKYEIKCKKLSKVSTFGAVGRLKVKDVETRDPIDRGGNSDIVDNREKVVDIQSDCCDTALSKGLSEKMPLFA